MGVDAVSGGGMTKSSWRIKAAAQRDALPAAMRAQKSRQLCSNVARQVLAPLRNRLGRPLTVFTYAAFRSEADPLPLVRSCWQAGDIVAASRIEDNKLSWRIVRHPEDWRPGRWGVPEPDESRTAALAAEHVPDAVIVPGLAFHPSGGRLGYGGGYYDRLYAHWQARGERNICWIGFAFAVQVVTTELPTESHDLQLDVLATEDSIRWLNKEWS